MTKKFKLEIELENDAFKPYPREGIIAVLKQARVMIESPILNDHNLTGPLRDYNGNSIGFFMVETD